MVKWVCMNKENGCLTSKHCLSEFKPWPNCICLSPKILSPQSISLIKKHNLGLWKSFSRSLLKVLAWRNHSGRVEVDLVLSLSLMTLPLPGNWDEPIEITPCAQNSLTTSVTKSTLMQSTVAPLAGFPPSTMTAEHKSDNETLSSKQSTPGVPRLVRKEYANVDLDPNQIPGPVC